jgi:hypothetical protein
MRALNRHVERVFNPERKDTHWGRYKLARDRYEAVWGEPISTLACVYRKPYRS